ncbi:hypothetical protein ACFQ0O_33955 [Saccharopolyspora spinosporotrichia]
MLQRDGSAAPVDTSEVPPPGVASPEPLPVPEKPVGGDRLGECAGPVLPEGPGTAARGERGIVDPRRRHQR